MAKQSGRNWYNMEFTSENKQYVATNEGDVQKAKELAETAKQVFTFTKQKLTQLTRQAAYGLKTNKAIAGFKKGMIRLHLLNEAVNKSVELAEYKGEQGMQAARYTLDAAKHDAAQLFASKKQEIEGRFEERRQKRLSAGK